MTELQESELSEKSCTRESPNTKVQGKTHTGIRAMPEKSRAGQRTRSLSKSGQKRERMRKKGVRGEIQGQTVGRDFPMRAAFLPTKGRRVRVETLGIGRRRDGGSGGRKIQEHLLRVRFLEKLGSP